MKTLSIPKENLNPLSSSDDYGLRKSISLRISSILKASNIIPTNQTLAQVTVQYQNDKKKFNHPVTKTPLIKIDQQKNKDSNLFTKKGRNSVKVAPNFVKEKSLIAKQSQQKQKSVQNQDCNEEENLNDKLMSLIKMITSDDSQKLKRCHSNLTLNLRNQTPLMNTKATKQVQISLPILTENVETSNKDQAGSVKVKRPSFLLMPSKNLRYSEPIQQPKRNQLTKSSYFQGPSNLRTQEQRSSHYQTVNKIQKPQLRLCINCESYVNATEAIKHEKQCLGFHIILKMSSPQLIDFLNDKISDKLNQLKQVQSQINQIKKAGSQIDTLQMQMLHLKRGKADQIINDLDAIRLKALKRFHTKNHQTLKQAQK